jgi:autotransporter-associated beta strand protein
MTYDGTGDFYSYYSNSTSATPPTTWTEVGAATVTMPAGGFDVGLFVTAHNNSASSTAVFDYNNFLASGLGGSYVAPPFTVTVNPLATNNPSPAITGTCSDPAAGLSVRVNGNWYGVANNNGAWTLPAGDIPALANGTYDVAVCGINTSGQVAFDSTFNELTVDTASPTVTLQNVAAETPPINSLSIAFSEPVSGFSVQNLQFTVNGMSLPLDGTTLTTSNDQNWTLGNLSGLTGTDGTYNLTVDAAGWDITDAAGNLLSTNATTSWTSGPTVATPASATPNPVTGTTTSLSVLGADIATGEGNLTYSWAATALPSGAMAPTFSANGSNAAKNITVTFSEAGTYGLTVTITDPDGLTTTSTVNVTVNQTLTSINASGQPLVAMAFDQFNNPLASQPAFVVGSDTVTITGPLTLGGSVTVLPASGSPLTILGGISGAGELTVDAPGTVVLSGTDRYTGGTAVAAGMLILTQPSAIAANTSLTVGAGGVLIFDPSFGATPTSAVAATTPVIASSADTTAATCSVTSITTAATVAANVVLPSLASLAPTAGVVDNNPSGNKSKSPIVPPAALPARQSVSVGALDTPSADQLVRSFIAKRIVGDWTWLGQTASSSDNSDQQRKKDVAMQALETVFAQYGQ